MATSMQFQEDPSKKEARLRNERAAQQQRQQKEEAEKRRVAQQQAEWAAGAHQRAVANELAILKVLWDKFQSVTFDAPPVLLPLEAAHNLIAFATYRKVNEFHQFMPEALAAFEKEVTSRAQKAQGLVEQLKQRLQSTSQFAGFLGTKCFGKCAETLSECEVSLEIPDLRSQAREAIEATSKLLRKTWSGRLALDQQAVFSIHKFAGRNVIQIGSSLMGSLFITVPHSMEPEAFALALLAEIKKASGEILTKGTTIAVIDGDHQELNYQRVFRDNLVVRSVKADCVRFAANLDVILHRDSPSAKNAALHLGFPANEQELAAVFHRDEHGAPDWSIWENVAPLWQGRARRHGFQQSASASATEIVDSLAQDKNVIIVVAHGDSSTIYLPAPPPGGSELTAQQVIERKQEITENKPVVYLFACETAALSGVANFSQVLLDAGAAAVIAPQTTIDAVRSVDFFEAIVSNDHNATDNPIANSAAASRRSNYREMECFLG